MAARDDVVNIPSSHQPQIFKISHQGAISTRLSRFHTPDFFSSNVGFHVLANLDFSLSPFLTVRAHSLFQIPARGFPCFSTNAARDCRRFRCFSPDFDAGLRRLVAAVDGSGHYKLFLRTLHQPSQPSLITSA